MLWVMHFAVLVFLYRQAVLLVITLCRSCEHFTLLVGSHRKLTPLKLMNWLFACVTLFYLGLTYFPMNGLVVPPSLNLCECQSCVQHPAYCCSGAICLQSTDLPTPLAFLKAWVTVIIPFNLMFYYKVHSVISWYVAKELKHVKGAVVEVWT